MFLLQINVHDLNGDKIIAVPNVQGELWYNSAVKMKGDIGGNPAVTKRMRMETEKNNRCKEIVKTIAFGQASPCRIVAT